MGWFEISQGYQLSGIEHPENSYTQLTLPIGKVEK